ncbi:MAG: ATP-grasp domain-containing protein [Nitrospinae bacterium]|nr:ATP-grasp domain-containing protein [Nitrospinota bacterium]
MYLGIDFLISKNTPPSLLEVNIGLPGGAFEYDLAYRTIYHKQSTVYDLIERISHNAYKKSFKDYVRSLEYKEELTALKLWIDGAGAFPKKYSPILKLEDKWVQYQLLYNNGFHLPYTELYNPHDKNQGSKLLEKFGKLVIKPRSGRHGRGLKIIDSINSFPLDKPTQIPFILQEYIECKAEDYHYSVRTVSFDGEFICLIGYIVKGDISYKGSVIFIEPKEKITLRDEKFKIIDYPQMSWEGEIWYEGKIPEHLKENLISERVAETILYIPKHTTNEIKEISKQIGKLYMSLNFNKLPGAWFEKGDYL